MSVTPLRTASPWRHRDPFNRSSVRSVHSFAVAARGWLPAWPLTVDW